MLIEGVIHNLKGTLNRVIACLKGVSTGDAIGKQTESLNFEDIKQWFPEGISDFHGEIGKDYAQI